MLVACGGLGAIVELISSEYFHNKELVSRPKRKMTESDTETSWNVDMVWDVFAF